MRGKKVSGVTLALLFAMTSCVCAVSASEDEGAPLMITTPSGEAPIPCAVFFADNMVYAPQWRVGNFVRIELMVLDMSTFPTAKDITVEATDLYPDDGFLDALSQQAAIMNDSDTVLPMTKMVSVSYVQVAMLSSNGEVFETFEAGWDPVSRDKVIDGELGREVNKAGHVIYGMLWDTTDVPEDTYTVEVRLGAVVETSEGSNEWIGVLGEMYDVNFCIGHLYDPLAEYEGTYLDLEHPYSDLVLADTQDYADYKIGVGGVAGDVAWVVLGPLIPQGSGGGNGDGGGGNGGGNSWQGEKLKSHR